MDTNFINSDESSNKRWAIWDRQQRNTANKSHFADKQISKAYAIKYALEAAVEGTFFDLTYNKNSIVVKVQNLVVKDALNFFELEKQWAAEGISKKASKKTNSVLYHVV